MIELKLTKEQKIAILKEAIKIICGMHPVYSSDFLCPAIEEATEYVVDGYKYDSHHNTQYRFPELWKYKPDDMFSATSWFIFYDKQSRIKVLNKTIKDIEDDKDDVHCIPD